MFFRYFLTLCIIAFFSVVIHVSANEEPEQNVEERGNLAVKIVIKIIQKLFTGVAKSCLAEAADECKDQWKNPSQAIQCAKDFLASDKGRCAISE